MPGRAVVFGASYNHGHSVVHALINARYTVRAVVSTPTSIDGADVICMTSPNESIITNSLNGADVCYVSTNTDFSDRDCYQKELKEGKLIANACRDLRVNHIILTTQLSPKNALSIVARHCDVKAEIEDYFRSLRVPTTYVEIPVLYEALYSYFRPEMVGKDTYRLALPMGLNSMDCMSARDVGPVIAKVARNRNHFLNKTLALAADKISIKEMAAVLSKCCNIKVLDRQITVHEFKELGWAGCRDVANYFDFITRVDQRFNVTSTRELHPQAMSFLDWSDTYRHEIMQNAFRKRC